MKYSYAVIVNNNDTLRTESVLLQNKYSSKKKYALIEKITHNDGSENIANIYYSNNMVELQEKANNLISWYNYPLNLSKNIQGYIKHINN